jgi:hypothetical protein
MRTGLREGEEREGLRRKNEGSEQKIRKRIEQKKDEKTSDWLCCTCQLRMHLTGAADAQYGGAYAAYKEPSTMFTWLYNLM